MKILITGVAGFLGSNLALRYLLQGHTVIGIDNFASSDKKSLHLQALMKHENFRFNQTTICDYDAIHDACFSAKSRVELVLNFACIASPPRYQAMPIETIRTSTLGVDNVLMFATHADIPVVHASTSEVYGDPEVTPQVESYWGRVNSFGPRACYDEGKRCAEAFCYEYIKKGVDVRIIRIFNTYGPNMDPHDGRAVSNFINQALSNEDITIHGDGKQTRSFCYVDDLVKGIMGVATFDRGVIMSPVNLGNPVENSIEEIAYHVLEKIPESTSKIVYVDRPVDDPGRRKPDVSLINAKLGWLPHVCLDTGLDNTIRYFKMLRAVTCQCK
jgi:UDP-glucuronate decarboxylase